MHNMGIKTRNRSWLEWEWMRTSATSHNALSEDPDMSDQGSWIALLSYPASGAGCEMSGEGGTSAGQNSGCEIFGWNVGGEEFRMWDTRVECRRRRIPDVRYPGEMSAEKNSGCEMSGWNERCHVSQGAVCVSKGEGATRQFLGRINVLTISNRDWYQ